MQNIYKITQSERDTFEEEFVSLEKQNPEFDVSGFFCNIDDYENDDEDIEDIEVNIFDSLIESGIRIEDVLEIFCDENYNDNYDDLSIISVDDVEAVAYEKSPFLYFIESGSKEFKKRTTSRTPQFGSHSVFYSSFIKKSQKRDHLTYRKNASDLYSVGLEKLDGLEIHHLNLNHSDNNPKNLVALDSITHKNLHTLLEYENQLEILEFFGNNPKAVKVSTDGIGTLYKKRTYYFKSELVKNAEERAEIIKQEKERILEKISKILDTGLCEKIEIAVNEKTSEAISKREVGSTLKEIYNRKWTEYIIKYSTIGERTFNLH